MDHVSITLLIEEREEKLLPMHYLMWKYEYHMKKEYGGGSRSRIKTNKLKLFLVADFLFMLLKEEKRNESHWGNHLLLPYFFSSCLF